MPSYEAVVIGAGPAGTTAAYCLARDGVKTLLVEKKDLPRTKLCGGAFTKQTVNLNQRLFNISPKNLKINGVINNQSQSVSLYFRNSEIYSFKSDHPIFFAARADYDYLLFEKALEAGVDKLLRTEVKSFDFRRNFLKTASGMRIDYKALFAADGIYSPTRNALENQTETTFPGWKDQLAIGVETFISKEEIPSTSGFKDTIKFHFGVIDWGYGWVFPHGEELVVGIGGLQNRNEDPVSLFKEYLELLGLTADNHSEIGYPFPFGNYLKRPGYKNVVLLGDAGGYADPLTGEGIYYAQRTGELASRAFRRTDDSSLTQKYKRLLEKHIHPGFTGALRIKPLVYGGPARLRYYLMRAGVRFINPKLLKDLFYKAPLNWNPF